MEFAASDKIAGRYRLLEHLGSGGFGEVWRAQDTRHERELAIKLISKNGAHATARREAHLLRRLNLPCIAELYDEGPIGEHYYLAMEYVDGAPFPGRERTSRWEPIAVTTARLMRALQQVHAAGVLHRDLKPANILVTSTSGIKLLDFGLAADLRRQREPGQPLEGSTFYLAPEQLRGEPSTVRSDIYALGVMLYEVLSGQLPREGETMRQWLRALFTQEAAPLRELNPRIPKKISVLIDRMIAIEPEERPGSMGEILAIVEGNETVSAVLNPKPKLPAWTWQRALAPLMDALTRRIPHEIRPGAFDQARHTDLLSMLLLEEGYFPILLPAGERPLESLLGMLEPPSLETNLEHMLEATRHMLEHMPDGQLLVISQQVVDGWTWQMFEEHIGRGPFVLLGEQRSRQKTGLATLDAEALEGLFEGPRFVLDLPGRAARELFARTRGELFAIDRELEAWVTSGLARWSGRPRKLHITHEALALLEDQGARPMMGNASAASALDDTERELMAWMALSWPHTDAALCAKLSERSIWEVELRLEKLLDRGFVYKLEDGRLWAKPILAPVEYWARDALASAREKLASVLPEDNMHRGMHALAADQAQQALQVIKAAREKQTLDHTPKIADTLMQELSQEIRITHPEKISSVLAAWCQLALESKEPMIMERALTEVEREVYPEQERHRVLLETARASLSGLEHLDKELEQLTTHVFDAPEDASLEWHRLALLAKHERPFARGALERYAEGSREREELLGECALAKGDFARSAAHFQNALAGEVRIRRRPVLAGKCTLAALRAGDATIVPGLLETLEGIDKGALSPRHQFLATLLEQLLQRVLGVPVTELPEDFEQTALLIDHLEVGRAYKKLTEELEGTLSLEHMDMLASLVSRY